jgi:hypothetical protein
MEDAGLRILPVIKSFCAVFNTPVLPVKGLLLILYMASTITCTGQNDEWATYMADYEGKPGSILVDLGLKKTAPLAKYPYLLVTGVKFTNCREDGLPQKSEFEKLYAVSDAVEAKLKSFKAFVMAGTFTCDCERLDYFYVSDTTDLRNRLTALYGSKFKSYSHYTSIKPDKNWAAYLEFLYPNDLNLESIRNQAVLSQLIESGDKLVEPRVIQHWAYFSNTTDRNCFMAYVKSLGFKVESTGKGDGSGLSYFLQFSRNDAVDLIPLSKLTLDLRLQAEKCKGDYDGWECEVIK